MTQYQKEKENYILKYGIDAWKDRNRMYRKKWHDKFVKKYGMSKYKKDKQDFIKNNGIESWSLLNYNKHKNWVTLNRKSSNEIQNRYRKNNPSKIKNIKNKWLNKVKSDPIKYAQYLENRKLSKLKWFNKLKADPIKYAQYLKKCKIYRINRKNKNV